MRAMLFSVLALAACGRIEPEFTGYVTEFNEMLTRNGVNRQVGNLTIEFGDAGGGGREAICHRGGLATPRIVVQRENWELMNEVEKKLVIFHEMGHCVLGREHEVGKPSIMFPNAKMFEDEYRKGPGALEAELCEKQHN